MSDIKVKGNVRDILKFVKNIPGRKRWINSGGLDVDGSDKIREFTKELHGGMVDARIDSIKQETNSTRTYRLRAVDGGRLPFFYAGQYISVKLEIDGRSLTRPYSISSAPRDVDDSGYLEITTKKKKAGYVTNYIWDNWKEGTVVRFDGAYGEFWYQGIRDQKHVVALAGGSGITPFRSIARDMLSGGRPEKLTILYGVSDENDIIFKDELNELAAKSNGRIEVHYVLSGTSECWEGERGFLCADVIRKLVGDTADKSYFVCGPRVMYGYIDKTMRELGIIRRFVRREAYGETDDITLHPAFPKDQIGKTYRLLLKYGISEVELTCHADETILVSLERAGYAMDSRCRSGECGWCRSYAEKGTVWYPPEMEGLRKSDLDENFIHPCSAYPMNDIVLYVQNQL